MSEIDLRECPFCGGPAKLEYNNFLGGWVACCASGNCAGCGGRLSGDAMKTVRFWNTRASDHITITPTGRAMLKDGE